MRRLALPWKQRILGPWGLCMLLLACQPVGAGSRLSQGPPQGGRPLSASVAIDFRITIVPGLGSDSQALSATLQMPTGLTLATRPRWGPRQGTAPQLTWVEAGDDPASPPHRWTRSEP